MISRLYRWWRTHRSAVLVAAAVAAAVVIAAAFIWPVTDLIAAHDVGRIAGPQRATQLQTAREAVRTQLLTLAAGVFVAGALWFTAQNFRLSRQGQVTDRYTKAIEQLGSDKLDVRIGAIYALERIARDSATDHPTVIEVLAAFVREHSRELWAPSGAEVRGRGGRPDIQAAVTVIGRRNPTHDRAHVDLFAANLAGTDLDRADLTGANLRRADLTGATLIDTVLTGALLVDTVLTEAVLVGADLTGASLWPAYLTGAALIGTNFTGANLRSADFTGANLHSADLTGANLTGAVFTNADLTDARLADGQSVPEGWLRDPDSGRLRPSGPAADDS